MPTIYDEENVIKDHCIAETTPIATSYVVEKFIKNAALPKLSDRREQSDLAA
jgi:hypothetical protein